MRWSITSKIAVGFASILLVLIVVGWVAYDTTSKLIASGAWVTHTHQVINQLNEVFGIIREAETEQRGFIITGEERYLDMYHGAKDAMDRRMEEIRTLTADNAMQQQRVVNLKALMSTRLAELQTVIDLRRSKGIAGAAQEVLTGRGKATMDAIGGLVSETIATENEFLVQRARQEAEQAERSKQTILFGSLLAAGILVVVGYLMGRTIAAPLQNISGAALAMAEGDLEFQVQPNGRGDEIGLLTRSFSGMTESLRSMANATEKIAGGDFTVPFQPRSGKDTLGKAFDSMRQSLRGVTLELRQSVSVLSSTAQQIVATTAEVASAAAQTATSVAETTTTIEEVKQTAILSAQKARYVSDSAQKVVLVAQTGRKAVDDSIDGMKKIRDQMETIAESIVRLSEQAQNIGEIMVTVNDLAEQSNLLAVNASIEAARAGEYGKGFSVVAQEVRSLADQSKQATSQIRTILNDIQKATTAAVMVTEQGSKAVDAGLKQSVQAGESVQKLADNITEAAQAATQIAASSQQQIAGMDQIATAMENIKAATSQNVASTRQTEAAASGVRELGHKLNELVAQYRL
jgi:methyl-accepting chemotaxis protein